jgi:hypothetical protein
MEFPNTSFFIVLLSKGYATWKSTLESGKSIAGTGLRISSNLLYY